MRILYATLHELKKESNSKRVEFRIRKNNFDVNDNNVNILVTSTINAINSDKTKKIYGSFNNSHRFKFFLERFIGNKTDKFFKVFTRKILHFIKEKMLANNKYITSTGGYVLFFIYEDAKKYKEYFGCVIFKQNSGILIDNNLNPRDSIYVDLKKLQQAILIDINLYKQSLGKDDSDDLYIKFISSSKEYSDYFIDSFGCYNSSKPEKVTENIINGVYSFFKDKGSKLNSCEIKELALIAKKSIINFLKKKKNEFSLDEVKNNIISVLNDNYESIKDHIKDVNNFSEDLVNDLHNNEKYKVPFYFRIDQSTLKKHLSNKIEEPNKRWSLNAEYGLVDIIDSDNQKNIPSNKSILINSVDRTILIRDVDKNSIQKFITKMKEQEKEDE